MAVRMRYLDSDKMEVFLGDLTGKCKEAGLDAQKEGAKVVKAAVMSRLARIKTNDEKIKHMHEDVQISTKKDEFGDTIVRIQGGKATGSLWHIVNDGTYKARATHFMDDAMNDVESKLEQIIEDSFKKGGLND
jgi:HK97 gp10 family phage protein